MASVRKYRLAILECDKTFPAIKTAIGPYYGILFVQPLKDAARRSGTGTEIDFSFWDVQEGKYPNPEDIDGIVMTGSHSSAYDKDPWIGVLDQFLQRVYKTYPEIRMFGSCFGHQMIAHALLDRQKTVIERDPKGYELGVRTVNLTPSFTANFHRYLVPEAPSKLKIQFSHGDHVYCPPESLPPSWECIGQTTHCENQGFFEPGRILTFQGHFEFDSFVTTAIINYWYTVDRGFKPEVVEDALQAAAKSDDSDRVADILFAFLTT